MVKRRSRTSKSVKTRTLKLAEDASPVQNEEANAARIVVHTKAIGSTGTESYSGYPAEEYLTRLRGKERADTYDQMRRSDPQIKMLLRSVKDPIKSANWEIEPGDTSEEAKLDADLVRHILFNDSGKTWAETLSEILTFVEFGHSLFEVTHKVVFNHPVFGTYNGIKCLGFRSQRTIDRWNLNPETDQLASVTQISNGDTSRYVDIPAEFLLVFTLEQEGSNYEGISAIRPCFGCWIRKDLYLKLNAIGIEKFAVPTPTVKIPPGKAEGANFDRLIEALQAYTSHESNYLIIPEGWDVTLTPNTYDPQKVEVSIDNEDKRMSKSFLANFLELGMNGFGSQSLSLDLSDFFTNALDQMANLVSGRINQSLIPEIVKMNRGPRMVYPKLKHSGISDKAGKELAEVLKGLRESDFIKPADADEKHIRKRFNLPEMSLEGQREKAPPAGYGGAPAPALSTGVPTVQVKGPLPLSERLKKRLSE